MYDSVQVLCPYCGEATDLILEPDVEGELVYDCEICCNPWQVKIGRDAEGEIEVLVAQLTG